MEWLYVDDKISLIHSGITDLNIFLQRKSLRHNVDHLHSNVIKRQGRKLTRIGDIDKVHTILYCEVSFNSQFHSGQQSVSHL